HAGGRAAAGARARGGEDAPPGRAHGGHPQLGRHRRGERRERRRGAHRGRGAHRARGVPLPELVALHRDHRPRAAGVGARVVRRRVGVRLHAQHDVAARPLAGDRHPDRRRDRGAREHRAARGDGQGPHDRGARGHRRDRRRRHRDHVLDRRGVRAGGVPLRRGRPVVQAVRAHDRVLGARFALRLLLARPDALGLLARPARARGEEVAPDEVAGPLQQLVQPPGRALPPRHRVGARPPRGDDAARAGQPRGGVLAPGQGVQRDGGGGGGLRGDRGRRADDAPPLVRARGGRRGGGGADGVRAAAGAGGRQGRDLVLRRGRPLGVQHGGGDAAGLQHRLHAPQGGGGRAPRAVAPRPRALHVHDDLRRLRRRERRGGRGQRLRAHDAQGRAQHERRGVRDVHARADQADRRGDGERVHQHLRRRAEADPHRAARRRPRGAQPRGRPGARRGAAGAQRGGRRPLHQGAEAGARDRREPRARRVARPHRGPGGAVALPGVRRDRRRRLGRPQRRDARRARAPRPRGAQPGGRPGADPAHDPRRPERAAVHAAARPDRDDPAGARPGDHHPPRRRPRGRGAGQRVRALAGRGERGHRRAPQAHPAPGRGAREPGRRDRGPGGGVRQHLRRARHRGAAHVPDPRDAVRLLPRPARDPRLAPALAHRRDARARDHGEHDQPHEPHRGDPLVRHRREERDPAHRLREVGPREGRDAAARGAHRGRRDPPPPDPHDHVRPHRRHGPGGARPRRGGAVPRAARRRGDRRHDHLDAAHPHRDPDVLRDPRRRALVARAPLRPHPLAAHRRAQDPDRGAPAGAGGGGL
ncbi:MAG: RND efflux system, inner membrane transporter, partial [uncultured Gemmatimonadaceae bacterium]